jgi:hypothetical protein
LKKVLTDIAEIQIGYQSRAGIREDSMGSHYLIQARDFNQAHQLDWEHLQRFNPSGEASRYEIKPGDILFLAKGQEHFAFWIEGETKHTLAANTFYIIRIRSDMVKPEFLTWWINQAPVQKFLIKRRGGSSIPFVSVTLLGKLQVVLPAPETQTKIVRLEALRRREEDLTQHLIQKKTTFYSAICLKAVQPEEELIHAKSHTH